MTTGINGAHISLVSTEKSCISVCVSVCVLDTGETVLRKGKTVWNIPIIRI